MTRGEAGRDGHCSIPFYTRVAFFVFQFFAISSFLLASKQVISPKTSSNMPRPFLPEAGGPLFVFTQEVLSRRATPIAIFSLPYLQRTSPLRYICRRGSCFPRRSAPSPVVETGGKFGGGSPGGRGFFAGARGYGLMFGKGGYR